jgi:hypothetical protein
MATLATVQDVLSSQPGMLQVTIQQLTTFINLARSLKRDILLVQPAAQPEEEPPEYLSGSIQAFLADACDLSNEQVSTLWPLLKYDAWCRQSMRKRTLFEQCGPTHGIGTS